MVSITDLVNGGNDIICLALFVDMLPLDPIVKEMFFPPHNFKSFIGICFSGIYLSPTAILASLRSKQ